MRAFIFVTLDRTVTNTFGLHVSYDDDWACFDIVNIPKQWRKMVTEANQFILLMIGAIRMEWVQCKNGICTNFTEASASVRLILATAVEKKKFWCFRLTFMRHGRYIVTDDTKNCPNIPFVIRSAYFDTQLWTSILKNLFYSLLIICSIHFAVRSASRHEIRERHFRQHWFNNITIIYQ